MPNPVKKPATSRKTVTVTPTDGDPFAAQYAARMSELGQNAGKAGGAMRMEMREKALREIALRAARARWGKRQAGN